MRNPRLLALFAAAALALVAIPAAALALPGDPPITPLAPPDGGAASLGELGGVHVTFRCPVYHVELPETEAERKEKEDKGQNPGPRREGQLGDYTKYRVRFSTSSAVDPDGQLSNIDLPRAEPAQEADKTICGADFEAPKVAGPTALYQGTVYWQVLREVKREACTTCATETPQQKKEREDKELDEELDENSRLEEEEEHGIFREPKGELERGPVWSFRLQPQVEEPLLTTQKRVFGGYLTAIEFSSASELEGATIELQRFVKGAWKALRSEAAAEPTLFFVKLPAGRQSLRAVAKSPTVTLPLKPRKVTVHKLGRHRLTSAEEDGRYKQKKGKKSKEAKEETPKLPLSFAVVDGGTRVVHLRASIEGTCKPSTRDGEEVPLTIKTALRSARIAADGTVIADRTTKGPEPQQVTFVGQLLAGSLIGTVTTTYKNCVGSRRFEAIPVRKG